MMARSIGLALAIAGLVACAAITTVRSVQRGSPACRWSEARQLTAGTDGIVHVELPQMVQTRGGLTFFGDNAIVIAARDSGFVPVAGWPRGPGMLAGVIRRPDGRFETVSLPHHLRAFIAVHAVGDDSGNAHVVWGESADTTADQHRHVRSIWYARYDGNRWSDPEQVFSDQRIPWEFVTTRLAARGDTLHVLVPLNMTTGGLLYARRMQGRWVVDRLPFNALYASLATLPDGSLVLAVIEFTDDDRAVILVRRSLDVGATWSEPAVLYRSGLGTAYAPRLVAAAHGLYTIWESARPAARLAGDVGVVARLVRADSLQAAVSTDGGMTWQRLRGIAVPGGIDGLEAQRGPDGLAHAFFTAAEGDSATATSAALGPDGWSAIVTLGTGPFWTSAATPTPGDSIYVGWDDWRPIGPTRAPFTKIASFGCAASLEVR